MVECMMDECLGSVIMHFELLVAKILILPS
jgi:hypothetical protein